MSPRLDLKGNKFRLLFSRLPSSARWPMRRMQIFFGWKQKHQILSRQGTLLERLGRFILESRHFFSFILRIFFLTTFF